MSQLLFFYVRPEPGTWVYLSVFLLIGVFFVFQRFWSVRNLDILLLVLLAPGILLVYEGRKLRRLTPTIPTNKVTYRPDQPQTIESIAAAQNASKRFVIMQDPAQAPAPPAVPSTAMPRPRGTWTANQLEFAGFAAVLGACGLLMIRMLIDPALVRRPLLEPNLSIGGLSFIGGSLFLFLMSNVVTSDPELTHQRGGSLGPGYALLNKLPNLPTTPEHEGEYWNSGEMAANASGSTTWREPW